MSDDIDGRSDIDSVRRFRDGAAHHASAKGSPIHAWWRDVDTALQAHDSLAAIVRDLAAQPRSTPTLAGNQRCDYCGGESDHTESCVWRQACEWAAAHPEETP